MIIGGGLPAMREARFGLRLRDVQRFSNDMVQLYYAVVDD